jgi:hypothetical protein
MITRIIPFYPAFFLTRIRIFLNLFVIEEYKITKLFSWNKYNIFKQQKL